MMRPGERPWWCFAGSIGPLCRSLPGGGVILYSWSPPEVLSLPGSDCSLQTNTDSTVSTREITTTARGITTIPSGGFDKIRLSGKSCGLKVGRTSHNVTQMFLLGLKNNAVLLLELSTAFITLLSIFMSFNGICILCEINVLWNVFVKQFGLH